AGNGAMPLEWLSPRLLTPLIKTFPDTRFVCMHIGYPYHDELLSLAKHYRNVYVDLCWAWSIDPVTTSAFVRRWIHTVPVSKLFGFGGDAFLPTQTVGFAAQARHWLTRTLQAEVDDGLLTPDAARAVAVALLSTNQRLFYQRN
ncbi:MAG: amidohydrolase family protein, partial [Roseiflexaceae bacterium]